MERSPVAASSARREPRRASGGAVARSGRIASQLTRRVYVGWWTTIVAAAAALWSAPVVTEALGGRRPLRPGRAPASGLASVCGGERPHAARAQSRSSRPAAPPRPFRARDPDVLEQMAGLQMQYAPSGYIGLWSRMSHFERDDLTRALERRTVVHGTLMRVTIHLVSARDYSLFAPGNREGRRNAWLRAHRGRIVRSRSLAWQPTQSASSTKRPSASPRSTPRAPPRARERPG